MPTDARERVISFHWWVWPDKTDHFLVAGYWLVWYVPKQLFISVSVNSDNTMSHYCKVIGFNTVLTQPTKSSHFWNATSFLKPITKVSGNYFVWCYYEKRKYFADLRYNQKIGHSFGDQKSYKILPSFRAIWWNPTEMEFVNEAMFHLFLLFREKRLVCQDNTITSDTTHLAWDRCYSSRQKKKRSITGEL